MNVRAVVGVLAGLAAACGDDDAIAPSGALPSTIALTVPAALSAGEPLPIAWTVSEATANDRVVLHVFGPGAPLARTSAGYHFTGSAPAVAYLGTVTPDGALSPDAVPIALPASSGQVSLGPRPAGDWSVVAELVRGESTIALAEATAWVAAGSLRLDLSRTWAGSDDVVRARVRVRPSAEPLRLSAWLTMPDGRIASLPGLVPEYLAAAEGTIAEETTLLAQRLGALGAGRYLVSARLETLDGQERGSAGAVVQVCDELGSITGAAAAGVATVHAFDGEAGRTASAPVAADGTFTLDVPAGTWAIVGAAGGTRVAEVGCGGATALPGATARRAGGLRHAEPGEPRDLRILVQGSPPKDTRVDQDEVDLLAEKISIDIMDGRPAVRAITAVDLKGLAGLAKGQMLLGTERNAIQLTDYTAADFVVVVELNGRKSGGYDAFLILVNAREVVAVPGRSAGISTNGSLDELLPKLPAAIRALMDPVDELRREIDPTDNPLIVSQWEALVAAPGETVDATIHVTDLRSARKVPDQPLQALVTPVPTGAPMPFPVVTDAGGAAHVSFTVPSDSPPVWVKLSATMMRQNGTPVTGGDAIATIREVASAMTMQRPVLRTNGDRTTITVHVEGGANRLATASSTGLALDGPAEVRLDGEGRARFDVVTDARSGPAEVKLELAAMNKLAHGAATPAIVTHGYVVVPLELSAFVEPRRNAIHDQVLEVRGVVSLQGQPLPGAPVAITLDGEGAVTPSAFTDASGGFTVYWRAPSTGTGTTRIKLTVVKDADLVERVVDVTYDGGCTDCPVFVEGPSSVTRGGQVLLVANQKVSWSASRGSITADGVYTAPNLGGNNRITATSVANPAMKRVFPIVEECTYDQVVLDQVVFRGEVTPSFPWSDRVDATCTKVKISLFDGTPPVGAIIHEHAQDCANGAVLGGSIVFAQPQLGSCAIGFKNTGPCGVLDQTTLVPDPDSDGMTRRFYAAFTAHTDPANPGGSCLPDFGASGVVAP